MNASNFVTLRSGLVLPLPAIQLALDLENRGLALRVEADELVVGPRERITDEDRAEIRRWRNHLIAIVIETDQERVQ
jgi:hypothetical protein